MPKKVLIVFFSILLLLSSMPTALATGESPEHLLTIICKPQLGETQLTEYDVVNLRMFCRTDGNNYSFAIYGYNNFTDKFMMPEGEYLVTEISIKDRADIILFNHTSNFVINDSTTLEIPITNSALLETNPIVEDTTVSSLKPETTTYYNPFVPTVPTTNSEESTLVAQTDETTSGIYETESTTELTTDVLTTSPAQNTTTESTTIGEQNEGNNAYNIAIIAVIALILLSIIIFFVVLKRRNSED